MATNNGNISVAGQAVQPTGNLYGVAELMGYAPQTLGGGTYAQVISNITFKQLTNNSFNDAWFSRYIKTTEVGDITGSVVYNFSPALLPVSNFAQTDLGNRTFATMMQQQGNTIWYLQANVWVDAMAQFTAKFFADGIQNQLIARIPKSVAIVKSLLIAMETTLFTLATGQFFMCDNLGLSVNLDASNPNNLNAGFVAPQWTALTPRLKQTAESVLPSNKREMQEEFDLLSTFLIKFPTSYNYLGVGYDLKNVKIYGSYNMRNNLATQTLNTGWPTDVNRDMINKSSIEGAEISRWFNVLMTDFGTLPYLQNKITRVTGEILPSTDGTGSPLGYGFNNVMDFSYLSNVVAIITDNDAIQTLVGKTIPFNPYTDSKTFYRLGFAWNFGITHPATLAMTTYSLLNSKKYIQQTGFGVGDAQGQADKDWTLTSALTSTPNGNLQGSYNKIANGKSYSVTLTYDFNQLLTDMTQAQAILKNWEPGMKYEIYNFPKLPLSVNDSLKTEYSYGDAGGTPNFASWARYRSLRALGTMVSNINSGDTATLNEIINLGNNQLTYAPWDFTTTYPTDTPIANNNFLNPKVLTNAQGQTNTPAPILLTNK